MHSFAHKKERRIHFQINYITMSDEVSIQSNLPIDSMLITIENWYKPSIFFVYFSFNFSDLVMMILHHNNQ